MHVFDGFALALVGFERSLAGLGFGIATGQEHIRDG